MFNYIAAFLGFYAAYNKIIKIILRKRWEKDVKIKKGAGPFFYKGKKDKGILLIHGFTSCAYDTKPLAKYLAKKGITSSAMLMKGHGTSPENLATTNAKEWIDSVEKAYKELTKQVKKIYIAGDSFGGNLALLLASKHKVDGVISMGTPLIFKKRFFMSFIYYVLRIFKNFQKKWYHGVLDREVVKKRITYDRIPLNCVKHVTNIIKQSRKSLKKITAPLLIMQSTTDFGISEHSVNLIYKSTKSRNKRIVWIPNAYHVFIVDKGKEKAFREIYNFIRET